MYHFRRNIFIILSIIMIGISGYMIIEDYKFLDALYMTVITLSTVGYGEVAQLDGGGRVFTVFLIMSGIGFFGYIATSSIAFVVSGELNNIFREKKNE